MNEESSHIIEDPVGSVKSDKKFRYRSGAGIVAIVCFIVLVLAAWVEPDERGFGTHTQLGMPACGFQERTGYPCVTCGMTTALAYVVRGQLWQAFAAQPAGALLGIDCLITFALASLAALTGKGQNQFSDFLNKACVHWAAVLMMVVGVVLASWIYKCIMIYLQTP